MGPPLVLQSPILIFTFVDPLMAAPATLILRSRAVPLHPLLRLAAIQQLSTSIFAEEQRQILSKTFVRCTKLRLLQQSLLY